MEFIPPDLAPMVIIVCFFGFVIVGTAFALLRWLVRRGRHRSAWDRFAAQTGLTVKGGGLLGHPEVAGTYRGRGVQLWTFESAGNESGSLRRTMLRVASGNSHQVRLEIGTYGVLGKAIEHVAGRTVLTGDAAFDERMRVYSEPDSVAAAVLGDPALRGQLMTMRRGGSVRIGKYEQTLIYEAPKIEHSVAYLHKLLDTLCRLGEHIESAPPPDSQTETLVASARD